MAAPFVVGDVNELDSVIGAGKTSDKLLIRHNNL